MSRQFWTEDEVADLGLSWAEFSARHPNRSYDSYEVKRRRVPGGTAGSRLATRAQRLRAFQAAQALKTLASYVEETAR